MRPCVLFLLCLLGSATIFAGEVAGLAWTAPAGWKSSGATAMRAATYPVPPAAGDSEGAECVVYFFGSGQGGSVQANIDRWEGQFKVPGNGKAPPAPAPAKVEKISIHSLPVTTIDVSGDYSGMGGPRATAQKTAPGYRLLGAIVEGPQGNVFIKFAGPEKTVAANRQAFQRMLDSFAPVRK